MQPVALTKSNPCHVPSLLLKRRLLISDFYVARVCSMARLIYPTSVSKGIMWTVLQVQNPWSHTLAFPSFVPSVPHHTHRGTDRLESNLATLIWKVVSPCSTQCRFRLNDAKWLWVCKSINKHNFCVYMFFSLQNECFHTHYLALKENKYYFSIGLLLLIALAIIQVLFFLF